MATISDIAKLAEEAGRTGRSFNDWAMDDAVQDFCASFDGDTRAAHGMWRSAYDIGRTESWTVRWTTAIEDYDTFGTFTVATDGEWHGKPLRQVRIDPEYLDHQCSRYGSGLCGVWSRDPREEEREYEIKRAAEQAERDAREAKRAKALEWAEQASNDELDAAIDNDEEGPWSGLDWSDLRAIRRERHEQAEVQANEVEFAECKALIPDGYVLIDPGDEGGYTEAGGHTFRWPRRDSFVYFDITVSRGYPDDAEHAVVFSGPDDVDTLKRVAERIRAGSLQAVPLASVPPKKVLDRIGHDKLREIRKFDVDGREVWVGQPQYNETLVLDAEGRIIRAKSIRERVTALFNNRGE